METARPRPRAGNLTAALVVVALLELALNRLAGQLFVPRATLALGGGSRASSAIGAAGPFLFQLTAVLALIVLVTAFVGLLRRGELYPRAMRFSVGVIALVFASSRRRRCCVGSWRRGSSSTSRPATGSCRCSPRSPSRPRRRRPA